MPVSCFTGFWRIFMKSEPCLCSADSLDYYCELAKILVTKREVLKGRTSRYPIPILNDFDQPWFGADLVKVRQPVRGAGSKWIALSDDVDPEVVDDASEWANVKPDEQFPDVLNCRYDARGCDRVGRDKGWEAAGFYEVQRPKDQKRYDRAHDNFPCPPGRNDCCSTCGGAHFRQWCPQYHKNSHSLERFFMAPTPQESPWPGRRFQGQLNQELLNQSMVRPNPIFPKSDQNAPHSAIADRKVDLRDLRRDLGDAHAPAPHDDTCVWPKIMALRKKAQCQAKEAVSYTHLTLPTIYSV